MNCRRFNNRSDKITYIIQTIVSTPFRIALTFFADYRVRGLANLRDIGTSKGLIFASNHNSQIDSIVIPCSLKLFSQLSPVYFVALEQSDYQRFPIGRYFYGGPLFRLLGAHSFKRGARDYSVSLAKHIELLKEGRTVSIYPEGKIVPGKSLGEAHGGVAYLARSSGAPIIPIAIIGEEDIRWWQFFLFKRKITVIFGKPINFEEIDEPSLEEGVRYRLAAQKIMAEVGRLIKDAF